MRGKSCVIVLKLAFVCLYLFTFIDISQAIGLSIESLEESEERLREGACVALTVLQVRKIQPITTVIIRRSNQSRWEVEGR